MLIKYIFRYPWKNYEVSIVNIEQVLYWKFQSTNVFFDNNYNLTFQSTNELSF